MSLRVRLAVALALLAAVSVVAVATTNYLQTSDRLHQQLDSQIRADARPLLPESDPKGVIVGQTCFSLAANPDNPVSGYAARVSSQIGNSLQCIAPDGTVSGHAGSVNLPVTAKDKNRDPSSIVLGTRRFRGTTYRTITIPGISGGTVRITRSLEPTEDVLASIRDRSMWIGIGVILLAAVAGWLIARLTTRPMVRLTAAAEEVATTGRLDHPVPAKGRGEVGRLARSFSSMLRALDHSHNQQQRLVQDASHELRTPLTSLRTNLDTLRRHTELDPALREQVLADMDSEMRELAALADELVQLAIDARTAEPERSVELDTLVDGVVSRAARRTGRTFKLHTTPSAVTARPEALSRAVGNLLDNATKFSPDDSPIEVSVAAGQITVRDHGPGLDPNDIPYVFDRFYRAVDARGLPGSGLGLSIARTVVEASGGRIYAANHPDGGAEFTIVLPTVDAQPTAVPETASDQAPVPTPPRVR